MNDYFFQFDCPIFNQEQKDQLIELALEHHDDFLSYVSVKGITDGNQIWRDNVLYQKPFVQHLIDHCNLACKPTVVRHQPGVEVVRHIDDPMGRNTILSIPLTPRINYPPTYFFTARNDAEPVATAEFLNLNACLLNTQKWHGLVNTSTELRINFQLTFRESFEQVRDMAMCQTLFDIEI